MKLYSAAKSILVNHPEIYDGIRRVLKKENTHPLYRTLQRLNISKNGRVKIIQIGANDGMINDPLRPFIITKKWECLLVEPLPYPFTRLKKNYKPYNKGQIHFLNKAITPTKTIDIELNCFDIKNTKIPTLRKLELSRKASFSESHLKSFQALDIYPIEKISVPTLTFEELFQEFSNFTNADLLLLDVEGYEEELITSFPFDIAKPSMIIFESEHLATNFKKVEKCLQDNGYALTTIKNDTVATIETL
jgi:FkbM family methyltransferase